MDDTSNKPSQKTLLLEDDTLARWVARKALEEAGAHVIEAADCHEAKEKIDSLQLDAFVSDFRLPDGNGREVIEYLRKKNNMTPVIVLSAEPQEFPDAARQELKINAVLAKPVNVEELQQAFKATQQNTSDHDQSMPSPEQNSTTDKATHRYVERFLLVPVSSLLPETTIRNTLTSVSEKFWIALDFSTVLNIDTPAIDSLALLAAQCRSHGGRLALIYLTDNVRHQINTHGIHNEFDIVSEERSLEALSRRLSSYCERSALLDTIILPDTPEEMIP